MDNQNNWFAQWVLRPIGWLLIKLHIIKID